MTISQLRNPVSMCGWCAHPMEMHDFLSPGDNVEAIPCAHCPDNTCDISRLDLTVLATLYGG